MIDMQRFLAYDHIQGLEREAAALRAERARSERTRPAPGANGSTPDDVEGHAFDVAAIAGAPVPASVTPSMVGGDAAGAAGHAGSPRVRLGRWLVGVGAAVAGSTIDQLTPPAPPMAVTATAASIAAAGASCTGPCGDDPSSFSHAA